MRTAGLYVRISDDPELTRLGVQRQEKECRELAKRLGWKVAKVYEDDDRSAYKKKVRREGYRAMLGDLKAGGINALVAWHPDRMHRQPRELEELIDLLEAKDVEVATVRAGNIDLSTPSGRLMARTMVNFAAYESEHKADRIRAKMAELRANGHFHGGPRPFGYDKNGVGLVPEEVAAIIEAKNRLLAGEKLYTICRDLHERGFRGTRGTPLSHQGLRQILVSPRMVGLSAKATRDGGEIVGRATWPAILEEGDWLRLKALLTPDPTRRTRAARKYLLSGLIFCGTCGFRLGGHRLPGEKWVYRCNRATSLNACGTIAVNLEWADETVEGLALEWLKEPKFRKTLSRQDSEIPDVTGMVVEVERADAQLAELATAYGRGEVAYQEWMAARKPLQARLAAAKEKIAQAEARGTLTDLGDTKNLLKRWAGLPIERKRAVLRALFERVEIHPHTGPLGKRDLKRFRPVWRV